jgi:hypothetical protein
VFSSYVYESSSVIDYISQPVLDEYTYRVIKRSFALVFEDAYSYMEIATNPPQPDFDTNYHEKVDISKLIYGINQTDINVYQFYQELKQRISSLKDLNVHFQNNYNHLKILNELYLACPIDFTIKKTNNIPELFCIYNIRYMNIFEQKILDDIKENMDSPIDSINGQDPFDYITNFGGNINSGKNPHSSFTNKFNTHNGVNLATYPLNEEDLTMHISFRNGKNLNITYVIVSTNEIPSLNDTLIKQFEEPKVEKKEEKEIEWEITYPDLFKCKVDNQNQVNVYFLESFNSSESYENYEEKLINCIDLFDQNNYPVIVILGKNRNYVASHLPKLLTELISPLISMKYYKADRILRVSLEKIPVEYAEKNISYFDVPIDLSYELNEKLIEKKKTLKNKRKPTDILIYTDGNSISVAAVFIKNFQHYGAGIVAGYFGNPHKNNIPFDSAQSTADLMNQKRLMVRCPRGYQKELIQRYNFTMDIPQNQYFYGDFDFKYPLEYSVTPVDERVEIFEYLKSNTYQTFIDEAKKIFDKYKNQCNPKNKKLVFVSSDCDNKFNNGYTHGGYECGDDGKWSNKCVPSYCDPGNVFNYTSKICVPIMEKVDFSKIVKKHVIKYHTRQSFRFLTIFPIMSLLFIFIFAIYYSFMKKNAKKIKDDENGEELITIK